MTDRTVSVYTSLEEVPSDFDGFARIKNDNYRATVEGNGTSRVVHGSGPLSDRPSAADFGVGTWLSGTVLSKSDGSSWESTGSNKLSNEVAIKYTGLNAVVGGTSGATNKTHLLKLGVPGHFTGVRMVIYHHSTSADTTYKAIVATTENVTRATAAQIWEPTVGGVVYNELDAADSLGWKSVTFAGASSVTAAAGTPARPTVTVSDRIPLQSVPRSDGNQFPLIMARVNISGATAEATTASISGGADVNVDNGGIVIQGSLIDDATGGFITNTVGNTPNVLVGSRLITVGFIFDTVVPGISFCTIGDSLTQNSTAIANGWKSLGFIAALAISKLGIPCGFSNLGSASRTMTDFTASAKAHLAVVPTNLALLQGLSPNGPVGFTTDAFARQSVLLQASMVSDLTSVVAGKNAASIVSTSIPMAAATLPNASQDAIRTAYNNTILDSGRNVVDFNAVVTDGATPERIRTDLQFDATHDNEAGIVLRAAVLTNKIKSMYGL